MEKLSEHQLALLTAYVTQNRPAQSIMRWLSDGSVIQLTEPSFTYANAEFSINYDSAHKIWFSQFANFGLDKELELYYSFIFLKDGTKKDFVSMEVHDFWEYVQNKTFVVSVPDKILYVFNKNSSKWSEENLITYEDAYKYVLKCVEEERYEKIGDLIKPGSIYSLNEI